jgi:hypothetical protein
MMILVYRSCGVGRKGVFVSSGKKVKWVIGKCLYLLQSPVCVGTVSNAYLNPLYKVS